MTQQHSGDDDTPPHAITVSKPNTRPGPTDQGGHGGMATREQEARERKKQLAGDANADGESDEASS